MNGLELLLNLPPDTSPVMSGMRDYANGLLTPALSDLSSRVMRREAIGLFTNQLLSAPASIDFHGRPYAEYTPKFHTLLINELKNGELNFGHWHKRNWKRPELQGRILDKNVPVLVRDWCLSGDPTQDLQQNLERKAYEAQLSTQELFALLHIATYTAIQISAVGCYLEAAHPLSQRPYIYKKYLIQ